MWLPEAAAFAGSHGHRLDIAVAVAALVAVGVHGLLPAGEPRVVAERLLGQRLAVRHGITALFTWTRLVSLAGSDKPGFQEPTSIVVPRVAEPQAVVVGLDIVIGKVVDLHFVVSVPRTEGKSFIIAYYIYRPVLRTP